MRTTSTFPTTRSKVVPTSSVARTLTQVINDLVAGTQELSCTYTNAGDTMTLRIDRPGLLATLTVCDTPTTDTVAMPSLFAQEGGVL